MSVTAQEKEKYIYCLKKISRAGWSCKLQSTSCEESEKTKMRPESMGPPKDYNPMGPSENNSSDT